MSFKDKFFESLNDKFKYEIFINNLFSDFYERIVDFESELEKYSKHHLLSVESNSYDDEDQEVISLVIEDDILEFRIIWHGNPPYIQVVSGDVADEGNRTLIDKIKPFDDETGYSVYWNLGIDKAFDKYLERTFNNVI